MREIIPLKKDILFKTTIGKITDINLNHEYKVKDNVVSGNVILSGTYKMMEASVLEEEFEYKIPFGISISKSINKETLKIEIDDFKYDIKKDVLSVSIDLELSCEEEVVPVKEEIKEEPIIVSENIEEDYEPIDNINNITNNIITSDNKYYTYKVYIFRENDTIESICNKYNVTSNDLNIYNDLSNIKIGDKIIIPMNNE